MDSIAERIERVIGSVMRKVSEAAARQDLKMLEELTKRASELRAMKDQIVGIESRLRVLENGATPVGKAVQPLSLTRREIRFEVTQGMINQNLLTLTDAMKRGIIRAGERLVIRVLPIGDTFETELLESGNKLRERGKIGKFYRDVGVHAGDTAVLKEITPGRWELSKD